MAVSGSGMPRKGKTGAKNLLRSATAPEARSIWTAVSSRTAPEEWSQGVSVRPRRPEGEGHRRFPLPESQRRRQEQKHRNNVIRHFRQTFPSTHAAVTQSGRAQARDPHCRENIKGSRASQGAADSRHICRDQLDGGGVQYDQTASSSVAVPPRFIHCAA